MMPRIFSLLVCSVLLGVGTAQDRPRLGVRLTLGVPVESVEQDSPAYRAGLLPGDFIVSCGGTVISDMDTLVDWVEHLEAGATVPMTVIRDGKRESLEITLPDPLPEGQKLGVTVGAGFLVTEVSEGMPAAKAGVRKGDVLVVFDGRPVESFDALRKEIAKVKPGTSTTVRVIRDGKELRLDVPFPAAGARHRADPRRRHIVVPLPDEEEPGEVEVEEEEPEEVVEDPIVPDMDTEWDFFGFAPPMEAELPRLTRLSKELGQAIRQLKSVAEKDETVAAALAKIEEVKKELDALAGRRRETEMFFWRGLKGMKGFPVFPPGFGEGVEGFPFDGMMENLQRRVEELVEQGLGSDAINEVLKKEFPDVKIRVHSDSTPSRKNSKKSPEKNAPKKSSDGSDGDNDSRR